MIVGDLMHALVASFRSDVDPYTNAEGWTALGSSGGTALGATLFRKIADANDVARGDSTFTKAVGGTDGHMQGGIIAWRTNTFNATTPEDAATVQANGTGDTTIDCPSITTVTNDAAVIYFAATDIRDITEFPPITKGFFIKHTNAASGSSVAYHKKQVLAGASGVASYTMAAIDAWEAFTVAVRPA